MKQSRRLLVILTLDSASQLETMDEGPASPTDSVIGGFDWQVWGSQTNYLHAVQSCLIILKKKLYLNSLEVVLLQ